MATKGPANLAAADFRRARRRAELQRVVALISGHDEQLLPYDEVRRQLRAVETARHELADIPLSAIVGSVGRYQDFTRQFMPLSETDEKRWVGVQRAMTGLAGVPPIEVYRLGDAYFVKDGNHRVSVARQLGAERIEAYVTDVATRVPFTPDMDQDDLILASEYAQFLEQTNLDELRPDADLRVTAPGSYPELLEHISVHRYFMGIDLSRPITWHEAVEHWYDAVYLPVARAIRQHELLDGFPGRTEADLYLFLAQHRAKLQREFGWSIGGPKLAEGLAPGRRMADLEDRTELLTDRKSVASLLNSILLVLTGADTDDDALRHGVALAANENAALFGLLQEEPPGGDDATHGAALQRFERVCEAAGVEGQFARSEATGLKGALREVQARAKYADVVVISVHGKLTSALLRRSPKPLLLATAAEAGIERPLLAYDGGAKANEALFALAYLSVSRGLEPVILHVERRGAGLDLTPEPGREDKDDKDETLPRGKAEESTLAKAGDYLTRLGVRSDLLTAHGAVAETIVRVAEEHGCDAIFVGSHSRLRWLEEMLGGVLDELTQLTELPLVVT